MPMSAALPLTPSEPVEKILVLPSWHQKHDQGQEGACVGFGTSMMLSILHEQACRRRGDRTPYIRYNPWWLWDRAKLADEWPETNPGDSNGTTVNAACTVISTIGHVLWVDENDPKSFGEPDQGYGITTVRWAQTVDEVRTAINAEIPTSVGINWYHNFETPQFVDGEYWIGVGDLGIVRGGHCTCFYGASDKRQAFRMKNSWGPDYPEVWMSYETFDRLLREGGEVSLVTDR